MFVTFLSGLTNFQQYCTDKIVFLGKVSCEVMNSILVMSGSETNFCGHNEQHPKNIALANKYSAWSNGGQKPSSFI